MTDTEFYSWIGGLIIVLGGLILIAKLRTLGIEEENAFNKSARIQAIILRIGLVVIGITMIVVNI